MFDPKDYREACAQVTLGHEKLEELITMTENTSKKRMSRPMKTVLIAAACIAALTVTAFAAPAVVQKLFMTTTVTVTTPDGDLTTGQMFVSPDLALEERDGRNILTVNEDEIDVTDAFAKDGLYVMEYSSATLTVTPDGEVTVELPADESGPITYSFRLTQDGGLPDTFTVQDETLEGGEIGTYTVTADESGAIDVNVYVPAE